MKALISLFAAVVMLCPIAAQAQGYPDRTVKIVVPYPAGGGTDTVARSIAQRLSDAWRQPVVVENRPGAAGGNSRQEFAASLRKEGAHWARLVKATGAKLD